MSKPTKKTKPSKKGKPSKAALARFERRVKAARRDWQELDEGETPVTAALRDCMRDGWTDAHEAAWTKLYSLIANVMRDGANESLFADS
mgnify:CR=1 FL=1